MPDQPGLDMITERPLPRRMFLFAGLGLVLTGCAQQRSTSLPGPIWPQPDVPSSPAIPKRSSITTNPGNVIKRTNWATGDPVPSLMNRMTPVHNITIHHDGMKPFTSTDVRSGAARLDAIRRAHRGLGWGDIGYHYAIDRQGRVWVCRPLVYQGAHVKNHNPGNIGVVVLGNFDDQAPAKSQIQALQSHVTWLMRTYRVPISRVRTHQEWETARTRCPGTNMQRYMVAARKGGWIG